jgi:hypothetical protein
MAEREAASIYLVIFSANQDGKMVFALTKTYGGRVL